MSRLESIDLGTISIEEGDGILSLDRFLKNFSNTKDYKLWIDQLV